MKKLYEREHNEHRPLCSVKTCSFGAATVEAAATTGSVFVAATRLRCCAVAVLARLAGLLARLAEAFLAGFFLIGMRHSREVRQGEKN
ncbi:MAG: hypothetical protein U1F27_10005 [Turneriella sp.]